MQLPGFSRKGRVALTTRFGRAIGLSGEVTNPIRVHGGMPA
jgi:hypothetical protein